MEKEGILLVEDDELNLTILSSFLDETYNIYKARNGVEALEILNSNNEVSLVISDILMDKMDGFTLIEKIKKDERYSFLPIIVITEFSNEENLKKAIELGASDFLNKPYNKDVILNRVKNLLDLSKNRSLSLKMKFDPLSGFYKEEYFIDLVNKKINSSLVLESLCFILISNFDEIAKIYKEEEINEALIYLSTLLKKIDLKEKIISKIDAYEFALLINKDESLKLIEEINNISSSLPLNMKLTYGFYDIKNKSHIKNLWVKF